MATVEEVRTHGYAVTPGRNVESPESDEDEEEFEEKMPRLVAELERQFAEGRALEAAIRRNVSDWQRQRRRIGDKLIDRSDRNDPGNLRGN